MSWAPRFNEFDFENSCKEVCSVGSLAEWMQPFCYFFIIICLANLSHLFAKRNQRHSCMPALPCYRYQTEVLPFLTSSPSTHFLFSQMPDYQHCAKKIRSVLERAEVSDKISEHMTIIITEMLS